MLGHYEWLISDISAFCCQFQQEVPNGMITKQSD